MALALTACGRFTVMPPPDGEPVVLKPAELATTWTDADGGTLTLKQDGTFIADKVCVSVSWEEGLTWSGTGTWEQGSRKKQSFVGVTFDADDPETGEREPGAYAALRSRISTDLGTCKSNGVPGRVIFRPYAHEGRA
ncbi:hypothetical protein ACFYWI_38070, partial [Streptomyces sp. NPDC002889]